MTSTWHFLYKNMRLSSVVSKIAINILIFHLGSYTRGACIAPRCGVAGPVHCQSHRHTHLGRAHRGELTLIKAQLFALNTAAERGISDEMEATHHRAYDQRRRLELRS